MPTDPVAVALTSRQLAELHRMAQERLGLTGAILLLDGWGEVNSLAPALGPAWFAKLFTVTRKMRKLSRRLAARYYNLARAIATGHAYPDIDGDHNGGSVRLGVLYEQMAEVLNEVIAETALKISVPAQAREPSPDGNPDSKEQRHDALVDRIVDEYVGLMPDINSDDWAREVAIDEDWDWPEEVDDDSALEKMIQDEALEQLQKDVKKILDDDSDGHKRTDAIQDRVDAKGAIAAGMTDKSILLGGRRLIQTAGRLDGRRIAWMRQTGPAPCSFCAMLASRGAVYRSQDSAGGPGFEYHDNCHCVPVPVFIDNPVYSERDRFFIDNWVPVTKGLSAAAARRAWRRWLTRQYKLGLVPDQDVYSAAA